MSSVVAVSDSLLAQGTPLERIERYVAVPRPGLKGCRVGRMTQDPAVVQDPELLGLVAEAFSAVKERWVAVITEAIEAGSFP